MAYAFDEFRSLVSGFGTPFTVRDTKVRYACALVAELAYHHVPQFEIDAKKRALAVPCTAYQAIVRAGVATDVLALLGQMDFANIFVVVDRLVIAVGISLDKLLFIGFRGTSFLFDWKINLTAPLVRMNTAYFHHRSDRYSPRAEFTGASPKRPCGLPPGSSTRSRITTSMISSASCSQGIRSAARSARSRSC